MATPLARAGTCSYNTVSFGSLSSVEIHSQYVYDRSGRSVSHTILDITINSYVYSSPGIGSTDEAMTSIRARLSKPGGEFHLDSALIAPNPGVAAQGTFGFGPVTINVEKNERIPGRNVIAISDGAGVFATGSVLEQVGQLGRRDVLWGPKPISLSFKPVGSPNCAAVTWRVQIAIPECPDRLSNDGDILEANYRASFSIDRGGYTRRAINGMLAIAQTRLAVDNNKVQFTADRWREKVVPPLLDGYRRTTQDFNIDESKNHITFTIIDEELPLNVPPVGVVEVSASERVEAEKWVPPGGGETLWRGVFQATYEVAKDVSRRTCVDHFIDLLGQRLFTQFAVELRNRGNRRGKTRFVYLTSLSLSEPEIYGRRAASFMAGFRMACPIGQLIQQSGIWLPVGQDWKKWSGSLLQTAFHPRGFSKLSLPGSSDALIDICSQTTPVTLGGTPAKRKIGGADGGRRQETEEFAFQNDQPAPEVSWQDYEPHLRILSDDGLIELKPLPRKEEPLEFSVVVSDTDGLGKKLSPQPSSPSRLPDRRTAGIVQRRVGPKVFAQFWGFARRVGFPIPEPKLLKVGGIKALQYSRDFDCVMVANLYGLKVYEARWNIVYLLPSLPTQAVALPDNPISP